MSSGSIRQTSQELQENINSALLSAENSSIALRSLYLLYKELNAKHSVPYFCRKAGIASIGYFSDVMHNKRRLHIKYRESIIKAFELEGFAAKYLHTLISIDNEKDAAKIEILRKKMARLVKAMTIVHQGLDADIKIFFFALEIFCAFGLFNNEPKVFELITYFSEHPERETQRGIQVLVQMNLVKQEGDRLYLLSDQVDFIGNKLSQIEYLKLAFSHGIQSLNHWFEQPQLAYFNSTNISVSRKHYEAQLLNVRDALKIFRSDLETEDADLLVRLNVQIYPIR